MKNFLGLLNKNFLDGFQNSLIYLFNFNGVALTEQLKEDFLKTVERIKKESWVKDFNEKQYMEDPRNNNRRGDDNDEANFFEEHLWYCLASGDCWNYSFDGVLLI